MKERPILFSGPMVRAILEGRKTQTRRVITDRREWVRDALPAVQRITKSTADFWNMAVGEYRQIEHCGHKMDCGHIGCIRCPFGQPGDRLWVRESWCHNSPPSGFLYKADGELVILEDGDGFAECNKDGTTRSPWKSPRFMPRKASRITLEITAVRVERLQDINAEDAIAEGIRRISHGREGYYYHHENMDPSGQNYCHADDAFRHLWQSINGPESWAANPFVWVVEFKRVAP